MPEPMILGPSVFHEVDVPDNVAVDLEKLIGNHACIMSMSGGGKSGLIRKMVEVVHGHVQVIVLDPEDEFYTLRERYDDYLIAGGEGGDCPATPRNAADLATMLLTTGMNAVIQLNDLHPDEQQAFVAAFIGTLMSAPRDLWHPLLLVLDETHRFAPQEGDALSSDAVRDLTSRGRKRGFTAVLATQRMAKINKNVTGDITNWMIGRVGQGTDRRVAADQLGFSPSSSEGKELQTMPARHFWAFGPAFAVPPRMFYVADTETTIVKAGQARLPTPPAPEAMREIMAAMAEAAKPPPVPESGPHSAKSGSSDGPTVHDLQEAFSRGRYEGHENGLKDGQVIAFRAISAWATDQIMELEVETFEPTPPLTDADMEPHRTSPGVASKMISGPSSWATPAAQPKTAPKPSGQMMSATRKILDIYEKFWPRSLPFLKAAQLAGVGLKSSQFKLYEPDLIASGAVETRSDGYRARSGSGVGPAEVVAAYRAQLSPAYRRIFDEINVTMDLGLTRAEIITKAEISPTSSTTTAALSQMMKDEFVELKNDRYRVVEIFR